MPSIKKLNGIILKIGDTPGKDKLLHVLTRSGFITAFAAPKRNAGKKNFTYDIFNYCEFVLYETGGGNYLVNSVTPVEYFYPLRQDMKRFACAGYLAQLAKYVSGDAYCDFETLTDTFLSALSLLADGADVQMIKAVFELTAAKLLGFTPCLEAERKSDVYRFALDDGRLYDHDVESSVTLPRGAVLVIYKILNADGPSAFEVSLGDYKDAVCSAAQQYILYHAERGFSALDFLNGVL